MGRFLVKQVIRLNRALTKPLSLLIPTHNREPGSIALASLSAVLVLCDAAVGGQSVFLLHFGDVQSPKRCQEEAATCGGTSKRRGEGGRDSLVDLFKSE